MIFLKQKIQEIRTIAENILYRSIHTYINQFFLRQKFQQGWVGIKQQLVINP